MNSVNKSYYFSYVRVRVDLGDDVFVDADLPTQRAFESSTLKGSANLLLEFINSRRGEVVEVGEDGTVVFDTCDLTCYVQLEPYEQISESDVELLYNVLVTTRRSPDPVL